MSFHKIYEDPDYDDDYDYGHDEDEYEEYADEEFVSLEDIDPDSVSYDPFA